MKSTLVALVVQRFGSCHVSPLTKAELFAQGDPDVSREISR
jgi:hypothetical protein